MLVIYKVEPMIPENEFDRLVHLAEYDLDATELETQLQDLAKLAAKVAGTEISLVNLIDAFTQWSVASEGIPVMQMDREDSVCQYTIMGDQPFEVLDLSKDERFNRKFYVTDDPHLRYYWGVPLTSEAGLNLGALCVLDKMAKEISPEKVALLEIIADEIVNRLKISKTVASLRSKLQHSEEKQKQIAHDIRGPLGGIIGLAQIVNEQGDQNRLDEVLEFIKVIQTSSKSLLDLADEILSSKDALEVRRSAPAENECSLSILKNKLKNLYEIQGKQKNIDLAVEVNSCKSELTFPKAKLLQIIGNLVSNAIKFTPAGGKVSVSLDLFEKGQRRELSVIVKDTGAGMRREQIDAILQGDGKTTKGSLGEKGFGFGLPLVKHLIDGMGGRLKIESEPGRYARFEVNLPV